MKDKTIQSCLKLCQGMIRKKYGPAVNLAILQYLFFFQEHQALVDTVALDPINKEGLFWKIKDRMIKNFLMRAKVDEEVGYVRPTLIRDETPKEVFEALDILREGFKSSMTDWNLYYYSISLSVPLAKLNLWAHQIFYLVVDSKKDAEELLNKSRKPKPSEMFSQTLPVGSEEERRVIDREKVKQGPNPFKSDGEGDLLGESEEGFVGLGNRR